MPQGKEKPLVNFYEKMEEKYMLKVEKNISLSGQSVVNGIMVESYNASISAENPENTYISQNPANQALYKENRVQCRKDRNEFEEIVYKLQDEMIAAKEASAEDK